jgi:hypothetical protein
MTIEYRLGEREHELVLAGSWEGLDAVELRKALSTIPADTRKLAVLATALDHLPAGAVQVLLAYIRYARSIPRPVHVYYAKDLEPQIRLWGLDQSGWEHFFHGR